MGLTEVRLERNTVQVGGPVYSVTEVQLIAQSKTEVQLIARGRPGADGAGGHVDSVNGDQGPDVVLTYAEVGAEAAGTATTLMFNHENASDPHPQYAMDTDLVGTFRFDQSVPSALWTVQHNLGQYPSVSVTVGGEEVDADITYIDQNQITVGFTVALAGSAFLN